MGGGLGKWIAGIGIQQTKDESVLSSRREASESEELGEPLHRSIPPQIGKGETISHRQLRSQSRRPNRLYGIDRCREAKLELISSDLTQYRHSQFEFLRTVLCMHSDSLAYPQRDLPVR